MAHLLLTLFLAAGFAVAAQAQDPHLNESGSSVMLAHSAFAHGYRHGYEEGYHVGNADVSLGTSPRVKIKDIKRRNIGSSQEFGPRNVFERGFHAGLRAGYRDGYTGRIFRAVDTLRSVSASLENSKFFRFDEGFFSGYNEGFDRGGSD